MRLACGRQGFAHVGDGVEHRGDFVGVVAGGSLGLQCLDRVGYGALAGAEFVDSLGGERDDWVGEVFGLLEAQRLCAQRAVDAGELLFEVFEFGLVLLPGLMTSRRRVRL
ncbi:MAG TPA: hypothetical protein VMF09_13740 [Solirubrobacteraceae bacterium]|nr:hypothetical protein [Solirubrobacteraceae bacterium]